jgi:kynurenine formamidase
MPLRNRGLNAPFPSRILEAAPAQAEARLTGGSHETHRTHHRIGFHTGWGKLWDKDNARYTKSNPGIGVPAAQWLIAKEPMLLGSDNTPVEVSPNPDKLLSTPIHQLALVVNGVHLLEHMKLDELAAKNVYEFAFVITPLKLEGATGSTVAPIAIR